MTSSLLSLLPILLLPLALLFFGALVAAWARSPTVRGRIGEERVIRALQRSLDQDEYRVYSDLMLPSLDGTTQIDHVVVSRFGVFVIETKNYRGLIVGHPSSPQWAQRRGRRSYPFQNPLRQNHRHVKAVESALGVDSRDIVPIVVFAGACRLHPAIADHVVLIDSLVPMIRHYERAVFSASQREELCARLTAARMDDGPEAKRAHVRALHQRHGRPDVLR